MHEDPTGTGATEYELAAQGVHAVSEAVEHAAARDVPAEQTLQAEQDVALAADQLVPATQLEQTASAVAEQLEERNRPAAQPVGKEHAEHGA